MMNTHNRPYLSFLVGFCYDSQQIMKRRYFQLELPIRFVI